MTKELLGTTPPFYPGANVVVLALVLFALPFTTAGSGSAVVATVTAGFLLVQVAASSFGIYYLREPDPGRDAT